MYDTPLYSVPYSWVLINEIVWVLLGPKPKLK
jgi:hypothetical protein